MTPRQRLQCGLVGALVITVAWLAPAMAESGRSPEEMWKELETLKQGQDAILKELQELRGLILGATRAGGGPHADAVLNVDGAAFLGSATAPLTLVEFSDYQ